MRFDWSILVKCRDFMLNERHSQTIKAVGDAAQSRRSRAFRVDRKVRRLEVVGFRHIGVLRSNI
jgi:hypothetical protein